MTENQKASSKGFVELAREMDIDAFRVLFMEIHKEYVSDQSDKNISLYYFMCFEALRRFRLRFPQQFKRFNDDYYRDLIIRFLIRAKNKDIRFHPFNFFSNFVKEESLKNKFKIHDTEEVFNELITNLSVDKQIIMEEVIRETLMKLPLKIRVCTLNKLKNRGSEVRVKLDEVETVMVDMAFQTIIEEFNDSTMQFNIMPATHTARVLMLNYLRKQSPATMVLMTLFKDPVKIFQFCKLFGGKTIEIPRFEDILKMVDDSTETLNTAQGKNGRMTVNELKLLSSIALETDEITGELNIDEYMSEYFQGVVSQTSSIYQKLLDKLESKLETANSSELVKIFEVINNEFTTQGKILGNLSDLVNLDDESVNNLSRKQR